MLKLKNYDNKTVKELIPTKGNKLPANPPADHDKRECPGYKS